MGFLWGLWSPGWDSPDSRVRNVKETLRGDDTVRNALQYYRDSIDLSPADFLGDRPSIDDVPLVRTPTLVLYGENDGCIGPELFDRPDEVIEECRLVRVREAGHFLHRERPEVVGEEVLAWV